MMKRLFSLALNCSLLVTLLAPVSVSIEAQASDRQAQEVGSMGPEAEMPLIDPAFALAPPLRNEQTPPRSERSEPTALQKAVQEGGYPAQIAGHSGSVIPDRYGPKRNDPAEGIPNRAYSPFDERSSREHPCPPDGCELSQDHVLVKLTPEINVRPREETDSFEADGIFTLRLRARGVEELEPVFPRAQQPRVTEMVTTPRGDRVPKPDLTRWHRAILSTGADIYQVIEELEADPNIAYAEPDYLRRPIGNVEESSLHARRRAQHEMEANSARSAIGPSAPMGLPGPSTDPLYDDQWHLGATNVPSAWQWLEDEGYASGGRRDIVVAVIDTGVDYNHPDLAASMWVNPTEFDGTTGVDDDGNGYVDDIYGADTVSMDGNPQDDHGHGTHVAGIIAAQANNNKGGVGVAPNVQLMALKAAQYSGGVMNSSDIAEAITYAVDKGADVINMSFGGYTRSQIEEDALAAAFGQAVLVAAAGNDNEANLPCPEGRDMYPAAYNWVLGVMASAQAGERAYFSNYDCVARDSHEYELTAPGVDVWSTLPDGQYASWDGTSMAAPVVSGIAALLRTRWYTKTTYSSRFIMGQIASNTQGGVGGNADASASLTTTPEPELAYLEHWLFDTVAQAPDNDDDGIVDAGETVDLAIVVRNHWGKADPVTVTLEARAEDTSQPDPYVQMITDTVSYGAIGSFNEDDNGLMYDGDVVTGVRHPFRFTVPITTPNDHVVSFRLTVTAGNGYDPDDSSAPYVSHSNFYVIVQRGTDLPSIISADMTLSKDYYWLVNRNVWVQSGVTLTVEPGATMEFTYDRPNDPYSEPTLPYIKVSGNMVISGTPDQPVNMFTDEENRCEELVEGEAPICLAVRIRNYGVTTIDYAQVRNPMLGHDNIGGIDASLTLIDHTYIDWRKAPSPHGWGITADVLRRSRLVALQYPWGGIGFHPEQIRTSLIDRMSLCYADEWHSQAIADTVFLQDNANEDPLKWLITDPLFENEDAAAADSSYQNNAFLSKYWDPDISHWMKIYAGSAGFCSGGAGQYLGLTSNYWGTTSDTIIDAVIRDSDEDLNCPTVVHQPILTTPVTSTYPFVVDVSLSTADEANTTLVGTEPITFTVTFNRDMNTSIQPAVSFGPDVPETDYTVHPADGGWQDDHTWVGSFNVTPFTGDGYQLIRVAQAVAADDPWLVTGQDVERFRFEIATSGTEGMNLQATGREGFVELTWSQDDFDLLSGFNLYRATTADGTYGRINDSLIPPDARAYQDEAVQPGQPYYYKFTAVESDMTESEFSNVATATALEDVFWADLTGDGEVNADDIQLVANHWRCRPEDGDWDSRYDIDGDEVITVVDIMQVAAEWGWSRP